MTVAAIGILVILGIVLAIALTAGGGDE